MMFIAHRGMWDKIGEANSLIALKKALDSKIYIGIETDVRVTKDGIYILYHDPLYKGSLVKNLKASEIRGPRLKDLLKIPTDKIILLEIKDFNLDIDKFLKFLAKYDRKIYLMSFNEKVINKIHQKTNKYKVGILNYVLNSKENYPYDFICILNNFLTDYIINTFKLKNIEVIGYGINNNSKLVYNISYIIDKKYLD